MSKANTFDTEGVYGIPDRPVHERQLDDDLLRLQRAAAASHARGQVIEAVRNSMAVAMALTGMIAVLLGHGKAIVSIVGLLWFLMSALVLRTVIANTARQGALLQERFDVALFQIPWRSTVAGDPVPLPEVHRLSRRLRSGGAKDKRIVAGWYDSTSGVHHPYDIFISQEQNLSWDARLRRRYANTVIGVALTWSVLGLVAGWIADASLTGTLLGFYVPSLAAYQLAVEIWSGQQRVAAERERLAAIVAAVLRDGEPGPVDLAEQNRLREVARDVQDGVFRTRLDAARVPERFYKWFRDNDERDFAATAEDHRRRLAGEGCPG